MASVARGASEGSKADVTFTDDLLAPGRTDDPHPPRDRLLGIREGDELLVDVSPYVHAIHPVFEWCRFAYLAPGTAAVYPYKVEIVCAGEKFGRGQYKDEEVLRWRRPLWLHRVIQETPERRA